MVERIALRKDVLPRICIASLKMTAQMTKNGRLELPELAEKIFSVLQFFLAGKRKTVCTQGSSKRQEFQIFDDTHPIEKLYKLRCIHKYGGFAYTSNLRTIDIPYMQIMEITKGFGAARLTNKNSHINLSLYGLIFGKIQLPSDVIDHIKTFTYSPTFSIYTFAGSWIVEVNNYIFEIQFGDRSIRIRNNLNYTESCFIDYMDTHYPADELSTTAKNYKKYLYHALKGINHPSALDNHFHRRIIGDL